MKNYYAILQVSREADRQEIKKAYIDHICFIHPDSFEKDSPEWANATQLLIDINEAYLRLGDPEKRAEYDALLAIEEAEAALPPQRRPELRFGRLALVILVAAAAFFFLYINSRCGGTDTPAEGDAHDVTATQPPPEPPAPDAAEQPLPSSDDGAYLADISRERPVNSATASGKFRYVQLVADEFYEVLLESDSTVVYPKENAAAIWTKHIRNAEQQDARLRDNLARAGPDAGRVGWFVTLDAYDFANDSIVMLKITYYDKDGAFIRRYDVPDARLRKTRAAPGSAESETLNWLKDAVQKTEKITDQHKRALQIGRRLTAARNRKLVAAFYRTGKKVVNFDVKKGGTITVNAAYCRKVPLRDAPILSGRLIRGTPVFVSKQYLDEDHRTWCYVEHINTQGWIIGSSIKVY